MATTKRAQILMQPEEYRKLKEIARQQNVSVAELVRIAVRERYLVDAKQKARLVEDILSMQVPVDDWPRIEAEILRAHDADIP